MKEKDIIKTIESTIKRFDLIKSGDKVLLGVSGGPDSMFMLYTLNKLKDKLHFEIAVATFNHKLRREAKEETLFVKSFAEKLGLKFFYGKADVKKTAKGKKLTIEEAARKERFDFLFKIKEKYNFNKIALAHNKDDLVETILYHIIKGCGMDGLVGISPQSFNGIIHPIIFIEKQEIEKFLTTHKIPYKTDWTNFSVSYTRNRIRHQIIPLITAINKSFKDNIVSMSEIIRKENDFLSDIVEKDLNFISYKENGKRYYSLKMFLSLPEFEKRRIIKTLFGEKEASFERVERIIEFLHSGQKKENFYGNLFIIKKGNVFFIEEEKQIPFTTEKEYKLNIPDMKFIKEANATIRLYTTAGNNIGQLNKNRVAFDIERLSLPLKVRFRRAGDRITIENGTKKLQDLFTDAKIPKEKRAQIPLLMDANDRILWAISIRRSALYKINNKTKIALIAEVKNDSQ